MFSCGKSERLKWLDVAQGFEDRVARFRDLGFRVQGFWDVGGLRI